MFIDDSSNALVIWHIKLFYFFFLKFFIFFSFQICFYFLIDHIYSDIFS